MVCMERKSEEILRMKNKMNRGMNVQMSKKEYGNISIQEILYLLSFLFLFGARAVGLYEGMLLYNITLVLGLLAWGVKILMTEHSVLEYAIIGFLILLANCWLFYIH